MIRLCQIFLPLLGLMWIKNEIDIWYTTNMIECYYQGKCIAKHVRSYKEMDKTTVIEHMPIAGAPARQPSLLIRPGNDEALLSVINQSAHCLIGLPILWLSSVSGWNKFKHK